MELSNDAKPTGPNDKKITILLISKTYFTFINSECIKELSLMDQDTEISTPLFNHSIPV